MCARWCDDSNTQISASLIEFFSFTALRQCSIFEIVLLFLFFTVSLHEFIAADDVKKLKFSVHDFWMRRTVNYTCFILRYIYSLHWHSGSHNHEHKYEFEHTNADQSNSIDYFPDFHGIFSSLFFFSLFLSVLEGSVSVFGVPSKWMAVNMVLCVHSIGSLESLENQLYDDERRSAFGLFSHQ